jgi:hypothetical protein
MKNQYHISPIGFTRLIKDPIQTLSHKGVPLKIITTLIPIVDFNLEIQLFTENIFLIKIEKIQWCTQTLHKYFTLETQIEKTSNMFSAATCLERHL